MKTILCSIFLTLLLVTILYPNAYAQANAYAQDYITWGLPEGAKARLGKGTIEDIQFSPDSKTLAVAGSIGIWLYDAQSGEEMSLLTGVHRAGVTSISFHPLGGTLASSSYDGNILLWDVGTGEHIRTFLTGNTGPVYNIAFSPDGSTLASGGADKNIRLWNVSAGTRKQTLIGHTEAVTHVTFSPDGQRLASVSSDKTLRLWNAFTGENLHTLTAGDTFGFSSVAFHPDSETVATGGADIRFWDVLTGSLKRTLTDVDMSSVGSLHFSPDGLTFASMDTSMLRLWNTSSDTPKRKISVEYSERNSVRFSPNGQLLAYRTEDGTLRLWDVTPVLTSMLPFTGEPIGNPTDLGGYPHRSVKFSPDSQMLASSYQQGSQDGFYSAIRLWNVPEAKQILQTFASENFYDYLYYETVPPKQTFVPENPSKYQTVMISFLPDGQTLAGASFEQDHSRTYGSSGKLYLWDISTGGIKQTFSLYSPDPDSVIRFLGFKSFSPDGLTLAASKSVRQPEHETDYAIDLWDVRTGSLKHTLKGHTHWVYEAVFSPDGETLASTPGEDILLWDVATGSLKHTLKTDAYDLKFSPDGKILVSWGTDSAPNRIIHWWDTTTGALVRVFTYSSTYTTPYSLGASFSVDDQAFAGTGEPGRGYHESQFWYRDTSDIPSWWREAVFQDLLISSSPPVWDIATGELKSNNELIFGVASPDRSTLVSLFGYGPSYALWDLATLTPKHTITGHTNPVTSVSFSPDGTELASASWAEIRLWDAETGTLKDILHTQSDSAISFSPNPLSNALAGAGPWYGTIALWDTTTGAPLQEFPGHFGSVKSIAFETTGRELVSSGGHASAEIHRLSVETGATLQTLIGHEGRVLTLAVNPRDVAGVNLASGGTDRTIRLWAYAHYFTNKKPLWTLTGHRGAVLSVAYNPHLVSATPEVSQDGGFQVMLASGSADKTIRLWDGVAGAHLGTLTGHDGEVTSLAFHPDGTTLMSGSSDTTIRWWELGTVVSQELDDETGETFVWVGEDPFTGTHKHTFAGHTGGITSLAFSPVTGWTLASGSRDGTVLLWDLFAFIPPRRDSPPREEERTSDVNNDGVVNIQDLVLVAGSLGRTGEDPADVNGDGTVDIRDLVIVAGQIGTPGKD